MQEHSWVRNFGRGVLVTGLLCVPALRAQSTSSSFQDLPDAPDLALTASAGDAMDMQTGGVPSSIAPRSAGTIEANQSAQPLGVSGKFAVAARREFGIGFIATPAVSGGLSHVLDTAPHYGTDRAGFGERYGAAAYRRAVDNLMTTAVFASVFHDDPRYYVLGPKASFKKRVIYAATRVIITRKDNGGPTINLPQIFGTAVSQGSAVPLYPGRDQSASRALTGIAASIGVDALLYQWSEFGSQILGHFHRN